ncbi:MAG TPA: hypothetical protein PLB89_13290 [Flavobacteriales bacterium]|nr:hypothetical protein [Flavobacteriales bacterium]
MKKHVLFSAAMVAAMTASAQTGEITSNRGENWLSQSGDYGLTFGAGSLLEYAGNLFNGTTSNSAPTLDSFFSNNNNSGNGSGIVIGGKKLIDANTAYRGRVRIGFGSDKTTDFVPQTPQPSGATQTVTVDNVTKTGFMAIELGAGLEKRVGSTRVVGIYGAEANIAFGNGKTTTEYGNALNNDNLLENGRTTESKQGGTFGLGINAFAGVEWFFAPKMSLSGEYAWGLKMMSTGATEETTENWDGTTLTTTTTEGNPQAGGTDGGDDKSSSFSIDTALRGMLGINFYFQ